MAISGLYMCVSHMVGAPRGMDTAAEGNAKQRLFITPLLRHSCRRHAHSGVQTADGPIVTVYIQRGRGSWHSQYREPHRGGGTEATMAANAGRREESEDGCERVGRLLKLLWSQACHPMTKVLTKKKKKERTERANP